MTVQTKFGLTVLMASLLSFNTLTSLAGTIAYTAPTGGEAGKFNGEIPVGKINSVLLPDGLVRFDGDELKIVAVPDWLFDRDTVLTGAIVRAEYAGQQNQAVIGGLVYFYDGQWLNNLASPKVMDTVELLDGTRMTGKIYARVGQSFAFKPADGGQRKINFTDIKTISSPRAYTFNIPVPTTRITPTDTTFNFDASNVVLTPSAIGGRVVMAKKAVLPASKLPGTEQGISNRSIATFIALDIANDITPAIAIPLVLSPWTQAAALNEIRKVNIQSQLAGPGTPLAIPIAVPR
jgi:hypothetical protein